MFSYILSFFRGPPQLSYEDAAAILTQDSECSDPHETESSKRILKEHETLFEKEYNFSTKTGKITGKKDDNYVIDNVHEFPAESQEFEIGSVVSYQKLISEGEIVIYNVKHINDDWDTVTQRESVLTTRIMICKVEKRERRVIFLSPGDIKVDLDKVAIEFIPYEGDWLELDVKYEVNEQSLDLSGEVIEVNRISPIRPHIATGKISFWDSLDKAGHINNGKVGLKNIA